MKKISIFITILTVTFMNLQSQDNAITVNTAISNVTVFTSGAEIQREGSAALKTGAQQIVFDNLPLHINPQSIQVAGTGNFTILGVSHKINHLKLAEKAKEVEDLEKSLEGLKDNTAMQQALVANLDQEKEMLIKNESIGGSHTGVNIEDLKKFADYFRLRLAELAKSKQEITLKLRELAEETERIQKQLQLLRTTSTHKGTSSIIVEVTAPQAVQAKFAVSYLVYEAGWSASYDLRAANINSPVELIYKANVYQSTNEDWKNVKPVFSTANPTVNNSKPELNPWYLSFDNPVPVSLDNTFKVAMEEVIVTAYGVSKEASSSASATTVQENQTSVEFAIDIPYTIPSDGQTHAVELVKHSLPAEFEYYAVRKLDKDVFLLAKISGWEKLNLLSGQVNIFFEGKFVGESNIEARKTDDALTLSLGRDNNITITRIRKRDYEAKRFLSSNITETREWDLTVHNKKKEAITIIVEDQIPVSTNKEIKVEAINISKANHDAATGKLTWKLNLKPAESQNMNVKYEVKYPSDKKVVLE